MESQVALIIMTVAGLLLTVVHGQSECDICDSNAACTITPRGVICTCNEGYSGNGVTCTASTTPTTTSTTSTTTAAPATMAGECDICDSNAACTITPRGVICTCNEGYSGNGVTCTASTTPTTTSTTSTTTAAPATMAGQCHICDSNAACTNTPRGVICTCNQGYSGNGVTCSATPSTTSTTPTTPTIPTTSTTSSATSTSTTFFISTTPSTTSTTTALAGEILVRVYGSGEERAGKNYVLICDAGSGTTTYRWYKNGSPSPLTGQTANTLSFTPLSQTDSGAYVCEATRGPTFARSQSSSINVAVPPFRITTSGEPIVGQSYSLTCDFQEVESLAVSSRDTRWERESEFYSANPTMITFNPLECTDEAEFRCESTITSPYLTSSITRDASINVRVTCGPNAACANTPAGIICTCNPGYTGDGFICIPCDECSTSANNCDPNAACTNTPTCGFTCTCNPGYTGDGFICPPVCDVCSTPAPAVCEVCSTPANNCDPNALCTNINTTPCSITCTCNPGYTGNGVSCSDIDECSAGIDNCNTNAMCTNTQGSFTCTCNQGYSGNGVTCIANPIGSTTPSTTSTTSTTPSTTSTTPSTTSTTPSTTSTTPSTTSTTPSTTSTTPSTTSTTPSTTSSTPSTTSTTPSTTLTTPSTKSTTTVPATLTNSMSTSMSDEVTIYIISGAATVCVVAISLAVIVAFAVCACVALAHKRKSEKPDDDKVYYDEIKTPPWMRQKAFNMSVGAAYHNHGMIAEEEVEFYDLVD